MRSTRDRFKLCLRCFKSHEHQLRAQSVTDKLAAGDSFEFWCGVRSMNPAHTRFHYGWITLWGRRASPPCGVDHYKGILNCVRDEESENVLRGGMWGVTLQGFRSVDHAEMRVILQSLTTSEALGMEGLPSGALKYAPPSLVTWFCLFINACICYQYIPSQVLAVLLVPLLKSKVKDPANSGTYRPIAIATALSKVLEKVVLHRLEAYLYTLDNQFSYKKGLGTEIFTYLGHVISHDMTDDDDINKQTTKLLVMGNTLLRKLSYCSSEVKMELFKSHCYSIYCKSLLSRFKVATLNRLKVCHNDILKRLLELPRWSSSSLAFARNGVNNLDVMRRHSAFSLK
ncbi:hypothetical protein GWK47_033047 [Chionoecetes opilio]|uniref:Reverse transcriptase n=1 Tax=Chionoecetes opilio TaxID=41210 RepID=A0A8J4YID2_CHIOP|nr:hypothetical protein GWK47_033047 [Chionoecetes opilio]